MFSAVTTTARKRLLRMNSLKSYCVQIACQADVVKGFGIRCTLTLSGIVLNDVETDQRKGTKKRSESAIRRPQRRPSWSATSQRLHAADGQALQDGQAEDDDE